MGPWDRRVAAPWGGGGGGHGWLRGPRAVLYGLSPYSRFAAGARTGNLHSREICVGKHHSDRACYLRDSADPRVLARVTTGRPGLWGSLVQRLAERKGARPLYVALGGNFWEGRNHQWEFGGVWPRMWAYGATSDRESYREHLFVTSSSHRREQPT